MNKIPPRWRSSACTTRSRSCGRSAPGSPLLVAGDGEGLVDAAAAGLLTKSGVVLYTASMNSQQIQDALNQGAELLVTDSNRKRAQRWGTVRENYGYTETADQKPLSKDVTDARLPVFPDETTNSQTVAEDRGVSRSRRVITATPFRTRRRTVRALRWTAT